MLAQLIREPEDSAGKFCIGQDPAIDFADRNRLRAFIAIPENSLNRIRLRPNLFPPSLARRQHLTQSGLEQA